LSLEDELLKQRLSRLGEIEALGYLPYGRRFEQTHTVPEVLASYTAKTAEELVPAVRAALRGEQHTGATHLSDPGQDTRGDR